MTKINKMICPSCGGEMNHHAEKLDYTATLAEPHAVEPEFGAILMETHACPKCGNTATRKTST